MKKQRKPKAEQIITLRLWTFAAAMKAVPYVRSLVQSLRDAWLELRQSQMQGERVKARPGRPDRDTLIEIEDSDREIHAAAARVEEIVNEMMALSAFGIDPASGLAVMPFFRGDVLAWFVFDLFDPRGLVAWRMHTDDLDTRRALDELEQPPAGADVSPAPHGETQV